MIKASGIGEEYAIWNNQSIPDEDKLLVSTFKINCMDLYYNAKK